MLEPRSIFALCSPSTQLIASPMLDFPHPLGPTTAVMPSGKTTSVVSENDLKPEIFIFSIFSMAGHALVSAGTIHRGNTSRKVLPLQFAVFLGGGPYML